jgi:hypothetical protein
LREIACAAKPDTILAWYRKLIAQKFVGMVGTSRPIVDMTELDGLRPLWEDLASWSVLGQVARCGICSKRHGTTRLWDYS